MSLKRRCLTINGRSSHFWKPDSFTECMGTDAIDPRTQEKRKRPKLYVVLALLAILFCARSVSSPLSLPRVVQLGEREGSSQTSSVKAHHAAAYCMIGELNTILTNVQAQFNLKKYALEPLHAELFVHSSVSFRLEANRKDIFPTQLYDEDVAAFRARLQPVSFTLVDIKLDDVDDFKCKDSGAWFVRAAQALSGLMGHAEGALRDLQVFERKRSIKYDYIIFARAEIMYLPSPNIHDVLTRLSTNPVALYATTIGHRDANLRITFIRRSYASNFTNFLPYVRELPCETFFNRTLCAVASWNECLSAWYHTHAMNSDVLSLGNLVRYRQFRRCGTKDSCRDIAMQVCSSESPFDAELCPKISSYAVPRDQVSLWRYRESQQKKTRGKL